MTKTESLKLVFSVKAAYPVYYRNVQDRELEAMADMWATVLKDYSFSECLKAVVDYQKAGHTEVLQSAGQLVPQIEDDRKEEEGVGYLLPPSVNGFEFLTRRIERGSLECKNEA